MLLVGGGMGGGSGDAGSRGRGGRKKTTPGLFGPAVNGGWRSNESVTPRRVPVGDVLADRQFDHRSRCFLGRDWLNKWHFIRADQ